MIDGHVHILPMHEPDIPDPLTNNQYASYGMLYSASGKRRRLPPYVKASHVELETLLEVMDEYGVEKAVLMARLESGVPEAAVEAILRYPRRIAAAVSVKIEDKSTEELEKWYQKGIRLVKFEMRSLNEMYQDMRLIHPVLLKIIGQAETLGMIVVVDPGPVSFPSYHPEDVSVVLEKHPKLKLVICHMGLPFPGMRKQPEFYKKWKQMTELAGNERVWLDVTAIPDLFGEEDFPYPEGMSYFQELVEAHGTERMIWGSDMPGTFRNATYPQMIKAFERCSFLTERDKDRLFYANADELYFGGNKR